MSDQKLSVKNPCSNRGAKLLTCAWIAVAWSSFGCTGSGSDIGPDIETIPDTSFRVLVRRDDESAAISRGVSSARVSISGESRVAVSSRTGRADFRFRPLGVRNLTVDASVASASVGDQLVGYTVSAELPGNDELPFVVYLPDLAPSATTPVTVGVQSIAVTHDDSAASGAVVVIGSGNIVGLGQGATTATLLTGELAVGHIPGRLPDPPTGRRLNSRSIFVAPAELTSAPGAMMTLPNEFGLPPNAPCELFRLDPATGVWAKAADGLVSSSGALFTSGEGVTAGGLYCFSAIVDLAAPTTLTGALVDLEGRAIEGVLVRAPQAFARTGAGGRFVLPEVASTDAAGTFRDVVVEFHGGRDLRPARTDLVVRLAAGTLDLGTVELDVGPVFQLRGLLVNRGAADPLRRVRISTTEGLSSSGGWAGRDARFDFLDLDAGSRISYVLARIDPQHEERVLVADSLRIIPVGQRTLDLRWFFQEEVWISGIGGGTAALVLDKFGHGRADDAVIIRDTGGGNGDEFQSITTFGRDDRFNFGDLDGQATASLRTSSDGLTVTSAFSARRPRASRVEIPIERARRADLGDFSTYGLAEGSLDSTGTLRHVRATRATGRDDWIDEVLVEGGGVDDLVVSTPTPVEPMDSASGEDFVIGVPTPAGTLSGYATAPIAAGTMIALEKIWFSDTLQLAPGERVAVDLGDGHPVDSDFLAPMGFRDLDPRILSADLRFDLALELRNGNFVDAVRAVGSGNVSVSGEDLVFRLPARVDALQDARYLAAVGGSTMIGAGATVAQRAVFEFEGLIATRPVAQLPVPQILTPASGATVSTGGFAVTFTQPAGAAYSVIELRSESTAGDGSRTVHDWSAVVPPDDTSFTFRTLPDPAVTPLEPGVYTLRISSARIDSGALTRLDFPYERIVARWVGITAAERQVAAVSTMTIPLLVQ